MKLSSEQLYWLQRSAEIARSYGLDPSWFAAMIGSESSWKPYNPSGTGPYGIGQFTSGTAREYGVIKGDAESELDGAARYLRDLIAQKRGDLDKAVLAYKGYGASARATTEALKGLASLKNIMPKVRAILDSGNNLLNADAPDLADTIGGVDPRSATPQQIYDAAKASAQTGANTGYNWLVWIIIVVLIVFGLYNIIRER